MIFDIVSTLQKARMIESKMADVVSKYIYKARLDFLIHRNREQWIMDILNQPDIDQSEVSAVLDNSKKIVIFGAGADGKHILNLLRQSKYKNSNMYFCDNNSVRWGGVL